MDLNKYTYSLNSEQMNTVKHLKEKYNTKSVKQMRYEEILRYEEKTKRIPFKVAVTFGTIGLLILGFSLVCVTTWTHLFAIGVVIGVIGIIMMLLTHKLYFRLSKSLETKHSPKILQLIKEYEEL